MDQSEEMVDCGKFPAFTWGELCTLTVLVQDLVGADSTELSPLPLSVPEYRVMIKLRNYLEAVKPPYVPKTGDVVNVKPTATGMADFTLREVLVYCAEPRFLVYRHAQYAGPIQFIHGDGFIVEKAPEEGN